MSYDPWKRAGIVLWAVALLAMPYIASAEPLVVERTSYFEVDGRSIPELRAQLEAKGPGGDWARSHWSVDRLPGCRLRVTIEHVLPKWVDRVSAPEPVQLKWDRMIANLVRHENRYGLHARQAAEEVEQMGCEKDISPVVDKWGNRDREYGLATWHGFTQGVAF